MVGVPGKYKGCETCRRRRCSNERPYCRNCTNNGRRCEGYERDRVFITGTPETKGRVASHPRKAPSSRRQSPKTDDHDDGGKLSVTATPPSTSAVDDYLRPSSCGNDSTVLLTALQTNLQHLSQSHDAATDITVYPDASTQRHPRVGPDGLVVKPKCLARVGAVDEPYCAFSYERDSSANATFAPWHSISPEHEGRVKSLGPKHFTYFPNHQFFVQIYRPLAVSLSLLSHQETFLVEQDWLSTPWERHPKSPLDQLLDIMLCLPSMLASLDRIWPLPPTIARRLEAQELLQSCLFLEPQFLNWFGSVAIAAVDQNPPYWLDEFAGPGGAIPFANLFTFRDGLAGMMMLYYWMSQIILHQAIQRLNSIIYQPVLDAYPALWPNLPPALQIDPKNYQGARELAANICRGLDAVLDCTTEPDMLLAPMTVALGYYRHINATSQDVVLEILWIDAFKHRIAVRRQQIANLLPGQNWVELARY
ncbi:hypothetical protein DCS_01201 [Drechmeria coniospora]|uniref:Zn(2)-C6 fungal-type domain-containing protein n=1 Tax=Drechmeria coniospora TaxID=98403 RepID=A0A151GSJ5_DRECN|nr:hypothetical protein DCS_01201 [Drechmeria coniospora]KYK60067.1 hypothetical protein DCS_01201 [Drechmeria coniospora]